MLSRVAVGGLHAWEFERDGREMRVRVELAWILEFRRRWETSRRPDGTEPAEEAGLVSELLALKPALDVSRRDVASVLNFLASVHEGKPIASAQGNLRALLHTFPEPDRRRRYARLARYALALCKRQDVLDDLKVARKLSARMRENEQETHDGPMGRIALFLYPEWFLADGKGGNEPSGSLTKPAPVVVTVASGSLAAENARNMRLQSTRGARHQDQAPIVREHKRGRTPWSS